ncbi:MAG: metal ABC transporter substrate-binding protein, partial [Actinomycetota bacterium]
MRSSLSWVPRRRWRHPARLLVAVTLLGAVAPVAGAGPAGAAGGDRVSVVAGFYPLAWAAAEVGGNRVVVRNLTPAGTEPHDLELTTDQRDEIEDADLVLVLGRGFQPAVEDAAAARRSGTVALLRRLPADRGPGRGDPHVWLDPVLMRAIVEEVAAALTRVDPAGEATYVRNAATVTADLDAL